MSWIGGGGSGSGTGDMTKAVYDADTNNCVDAASGGTNIDTSASTGVAKVTSGTWSVGLITAASSEGAVALQATTPGTQQTGNLSVSGDGLFGLDVGVGTTAPTARFQVVQPTTGRGTVAVSGTAVTGVGTRFTDTFKVGDTITVVTTSGSETKAITTVTSDTVLITAAFAGTAAAGTAYTLVGGTRFSVLGNGNVGIGTTSPTNLLSLGGTAARTIWMERNTTAATAGQGLTLSSGGAIAGTADLAGGDLTLQSGISTGTGTSAMHFYTATAGSTGTADNTPTEKMTILGNGNVGIGTASPTSTLDVYANSAVNVVNITQAGAWDNNFALNVSGYSNLSGFRINGADGARSLYARSDRQLGFATEEAPITFTTQIYNERMRILANGNVGIGAMTPTAKLDVAGKVVSSQSANAALTTTSVLATALPASYGQLIVADVTNGATGIFRLEDTTISSISANAEFSTTKDTAVHVNVYWETDQFKVQNLSVGTISVKVGFFGVQ